MPPHDGCCGPVGDAVAIPPGRFPGPSVTARQSIGRVTWAEVEEALIVRVLRWEIWVQNDILLGIKKVSGWVKGRFI